MAAARGTSWLAPPLSAQLVIYISLLKGRFTLQLLDTAFHKFVLAMRKYQAVWTSETRRKRSPMRQMSLLRTGDSTITYNLGYS